MAGETIITIAGNLTRDPEVRTTSSNKAVANFSIAASTRAYNRDTGQWEDGDTLFMNCSAWGELANHIAASLAKGMRVIAQGRLYQRSYQAKDGTQRTVVEMTVDEIGPSLRLATAQVHRAQRNNGGYPPQQGTGGFGQQPAQPPQQNATSDPWGAPAANTANGGFGGFGTTAPEPEF